MIGKLGLKPHDPARMALIPRMATYVSGELPTPPDSIDWTRDIAPNNWGMYLNDQLGDCTAAAVAHAMALWESYCPPLTFMTNAEVLRIYEKTGGYVPGNEATDNGATCLDVLSFWTRHGIPVPGGVHDHLGGYCRIGNLKNHLRVMQGLWLFGCLYVGVNLTVAQQTQDLWDVTGDQTPWGGHCIVVAAADPDGLTCITWGYTQRITWAFWDAQVAEAYPLLDSRWVNYNGSPLSPSNFRIAELQADLQMLVA